jgi:hypothetical protein
MVAEMAVKAIVMPVVLETFYQEAEMELLAQEAAPVILVFLLVE